MASITETDYFTTETRGHGLRIWARIRLLRRRWHRRLLIARMRRELADPRLLADIGATESVFRREVAALARVLGGP